MYREKNFDQAIAAYDRAILLAPDSFDAFYWRGRVFVEKGRGDRALADMQKTVALRPDHVNAWRWFGYLQGKNNRFDECIASLTKAVDLKPDHGWTLFNRNPPPNFCSSSENVLTSHCYCLSLPLSS